MTGSRDRLFEFTAFSGADLLADGDNWLNIGDSFATPFSAAAEFTVRDNDSRLSGDAQRNEQGDDRRGQIADIELNGVSAYVGVKIYAEQFYVVRDQFGAEFRLIEIEVAGEATTDRQDFYAFLGDIPAPGSQLTIVSQHNVVGNWISYRKLSAGLNWVLDNDNTVLIEAEDLALRNYRIDDVDAASGGEVIKLRRGEGEASLIFGAESGVYSFNIAYIDENDGEGAIEVFINGTLIQTINLTANNNGNGGDGSTISTLTIADLSIDQGDEFVLRGVRDAWEFARIDALTFEKVELPEASDDAFATDEDVGLSGNVVANDEDPNGGDLSVVLLNDVEHGVLTLNVDGTFTYTPNADFNGEDSFTYQVANAAGVDTATVRLTVNPVNDAPVAQPANVAGDEDTVISGMLAAADVEGDDLTFLIESGPANGVVALEANGAFTYTPDTDFNGVDGFTFTVLDGQGGAATQTATITVNAVNDAPVAGDDLFTTPEDTPILLDPAVLLANDTDIDGDQLTFAGFIGITNGRIDTQPDGTVLFTPAENFVGVAELRYQVRDDGVLFAQGSVFIDVIEVNDSPVAQPTNVSGDEDTLISGMLEATDVDGDDLTFLIESGPANGVMALAADGAFTYTPEADFNGVDGFTFTVLDGQGGEATQAATITVNAVNDAPVAVDDLFTTPEDTPILLDPAVLLANDTDVDGDQLTFAGFIGITNGRIDTQPDGTVLFTPAENFVGVAELRYQVRDDGVLFAQGSVFIEVIEANDPPVAQPASVSGDEDTLILGMLEATDVDGDDLTFLIETGPVNGVVALGADGAFTYTPDVEFNGIDGFTFTVLDGQGGAATQTATITVNAVNDAPRRGRRYVHDAGGHADPSRSSGAAGERHRRRWRPADIRRVHLDRRWPHRHSA